LLKRYFDAKGALAGFNFAAMTEAKIDPLFDAWKALPNTQHNAMFVEFCAIMDEAQWYFAQGTDPNAYSAFADQLSALTNHFERAMVRQYKLARDQQSRVLAQANPEYRPFSITAQLVA
jgi:hypothetical protein